MRSFYFFFKRTDAFLLFSEQLFPLLSFPLLPHKRVHYKDLNQVDDQEKAPGKDGPKVPVISFPVLKYFVEENEENRTYQEKNEMAVQVLFLADTPLCVFQLFVLLEVQGTSLFVFG